MELILNIMMRLMLYKELIMNNSVGEAPSLLPYKELIKHNAVDETPPFLS